MEFVASFQLSIYGMTEKNLRCTQIKNRWMVLPYGEEMGRVGVSAEKHHERYLSIVSRVQSCNDYGDSDKEEWEFIEWPHRKVTENYMTTSLRELSSERTENFSKKNNPRLISRLTWF